MRSAALLLACLATAAGAAEAGGYAGLTLEQALEKLRARGLALFYSSDLVRPAMRVAAEPASSDPGAILDEILAPHGLAASPAPGGGFLLVRARPLPPPPVPVRPALTPLAEVVVSASHYQFGFETAVRPAVFSAADLEMLPEMGDDPIRAVSRLPGVARGDFTSRMHLRGGAADETLVLFDDLRLYNPYHFKDFFGLFSTIDPGIISDVSVYTGGFPVSYGDRSSGVIAITPREAEDRLYGQVLLSFFSAGAAAGGHFDEGDGDWLVSARRGNMDLIFDATEKALGEPKYHDLYARVGRRIGENARLTANALFFDDKLTAFDSDQEEGARATYRDQYTWLRLDAGGEEQGGRLLLAHTRLASHRSGSAGLPGIGSGTLDDRREFTIDSFQADGWRRLAPWSLLQGGAEWRRLRGRYDYADDVDFELRFDVPGAGSDTSRTRQLQVRPDGDQFGAYLNWRLEPDPRFSADLGLRWDRETLARGDGSQLSPRAVLLWSPREGTRLRLSWGRHFQAQGINELPVPDGQTVYARAQRATHRVASLEQRLTESLTLRVEAYRKDYRNPLPRYENLLNTLVVLPELKPDRILIAPRSATAEGAEAGLVYDARPWSAWLSYSWARVDDHVGGEDFRRSWDQRGYASGGLSYRGARWDLSLAGTWHSGWPTTEVELETLDPFPVVTAGKRNGRKLGGYARVDLRLARRFDFENGSELSVFAEVTNALGRKNECCVEYEVEEDEETGERDLDVQVLRSLPLVPSLGFVWRF